MSQWFTTPEIRRLLLLAGGLALVVVVVRLVQRSVGAHIKDSETRYRARKAVSFVGYLAGGLLVMGALGLRVSGVGVAFGVAGAGVAFALQEVIASVAGWVALSFSRFYAPGDRVQLGGIRGDVIDIGILRTTLMETGEWVNGDLYNGRIVRIANSFVFKEPVFNYSGDFPFLWDEIRLPVKYGSDRDLAERILREAAAAIVASYVPVAAEAWREMVVKYRIEDAAVEPMITLVATDNWMEYTLRYVVDYRRRRSTKDLLFRRILDAVDRSGGRVGLASTTIQLVDLPTLKVDVGPGRPGPG